VSPGDYHTGNLVSFSSHAHYSPAKLLVLKEDVDKISHPTAKHLDQLKRFLAKYRPLEHRQDFAYDLGDMALLGSAREYTWMDDKVATLAHRCPFPLDKSKATGIQGLIRSIDLPLSHFQDLKAFD
jgi:hypothetical protein